MAKDSESQPRGLRLVSQVPHFRTLPPSQESLLLLWKPPSCPLTSPSCLEHPKLQLFLPSHPSSHLLFPPAVLHTSPFSPSATCTCSESSSALLLPIPLPPKKPGNSLTLASPSLSSHVRGPWSHGTLSLTATTPAQPQHRVRSQQPSGPWLSPHTWGAR